MEECTNCGQWLGAGSLAPAHSNLSEHGKGKGLKAHDCFFAALCNACHKWLDNQGGSGKDPSGLWDSTPEDRRAMFLRAMARTWRKLWTLDFIRVNT
jgi:hypothetical protein